MPLIDLPTLRERVRRSAGAEPRAWARARAIEPNNLHAFLGGHGLPCRNVLRAVDAEQVTLYRVPDEQWPSDGVENCR